MADNGERPTDAEIELTRDKVRLAHTVAIIFGILAGLVLVTFPLDIVRKIFEAIAGQDTNFNFSLGVGITITVTISIPSYGAYKLLWQGRELVRLRERIGRLEAQLRGLGQRPVR